MNTTKIAIITGGTSGIGRATAIKLQQANYRVIATGVFEHEIEHAQNDPLLSNIEFLQLNVADSKEVSTLFEQFDHLDALVNCAGIGRGSEEFNETGFQQTLDININGTMRCCYAAQKALSKKKGAIVNVASVFSFFGSPSAPAYSASKGAVMQFTKSLANAWAEDGIRSNAVAPGWIETPMTTLMQEDKDRNRRVLERTPMARWGKPEEIANAIVFLLSEQASFITGVILPVDGGYCIKGI